MILGLRKLGSWPWPFLLELAMRKCLVLVWYLKGWWESRWAEGQSRGEADGVPEGAVALYGTCRYLDKLCLGQASEGADMYRAA